MKIFSAKKHNKKQNAACGSSDAFSTRPFVWRYANMKISIFLSIHAFLLVLATPIVFSQEDQNSFHKKRNEAYEYYSRLDGMWEGTLSSEELQGNYPGQPFEFKLRLHIEDHSISVERYEKNEWVESGYVFKLIRNGTNAVVYAHARGGAWEESYSFTMTLKNIGTMKVVWNRVVNNYMEPEESKEARAFFSGLSTFIKIDA